MRLFPVKEIGMQEGFGAKAVLHRWLWRWKRSHDKRRRLFPKAESGPWRRASKEMQTCHPPPRGTELNQQLPWAGKQISPQIRIQPPKTLISALWYPVAQDSDLQNSEIVSHCPKAAKFVVIYHAQQKANTDRYTRCLQLWNINMSKAIKEYTNYG